MRDVIEGLDELADKFANMKVNTLSIENQVVDDDVYNFYFDRIHQCYIDGCPKAANAYMEMLCDSDANSLTKARVLLAFSEDSHED